MKKVFCVLLSVVIVMSCFVFSVSAFEIDDLYRNIIDGKWNLGDVDLDDTITSADARLALRAAVGLEHFEKDSKQYKASDYNKDGEITAGDARCILRVAVGLSSSDKSKAELEQAVIDMFEDNGYDNYELYRVSNDGTIIKTYVQGDTLVCECIFPSKAYSQSELNELKSSLEKSYGKTYARQDKLIVVEAYREYSGLQSATYMERFLVDDGTLLFQAKYPYSEEQMK